MAGATARTRPTMRRCACDAIGGSIGATVATSDIQAALARSYHRASLASAEQAKTEREARNRAVRALRAADPQRWTYGALAAAVGCSRELIALIITGTNRGGPHGEMP